MLTADLALSWERNGEIRPRRINSQDARWLETAAALVALFKEHVGRTRGELEEALTGYVGAETNYRVVRGLVKLLFDRCEFETAVAFDPAEVRRALFLKARAVHPLDGEGRTRGAVLAELGAELSREPESLLAGLYADLPARQRIAAFAELDARSLIDLFNLAQAQALLYRCTGMRLKIKPQAPDGYRALFGAIKTHRLIHTIMGDPSRGYEVRLDGPVSLFHRSQKYGVQMSVFLRDLLACDGWEMSAEIQTKAGTTVFALDSERHGLREFDEGLPGYENPVREKLIEGWSHFDSAWTLEASSEVLGLGETALVPDFMLRHPGGQIVYLELLGFWTPKYLSQRLRELEQAGVRNFLLAAWEELRGSREPFARESPQVVIFKRSLDPAAVEWAAEKLVVKELSPA